MQITLYLKLLLRYVSRFKIVFRDNKKNARTYPNSHRPLGFVISQRLAKRSFLHLNSAQPSNPEIPILNSSCHPIIL